MNELLLTTWAEIKPIFFVFLLAIGGHLVTMVEQLLPERFRWVSNFLRMFLDTYITNTAAKNQALLEELAYNAVVATHEKIGDTAQGMAKDAYAKLANTESIGKLRQAVSALPEVPELSKTVADPNVAEQLVSSAWRRAKTELNISGLQFSED